jgi:hypothetical protein
VSVVDSVALLADDVRHRWSISSARPSDAPLGLPAISAWSLGASRRLAPWER